MKVGDKRSLYLCTGKGSGQHPEAGRFLRGLETGIVAPQALRVVINDGTKMSYHLYRGGRFLGLCIPKGHGKPGDIVSAEIEPLTLSGFVRNLRPITYSNVHNLKWVNDSVELSRFELSRNRFTVNGCQEGVLGAPNRFSIVGRVTRYPGISNQHQGVYLEFIILDYVGREYRLRIRDSGFNLPSFQFPLGASFKSVHLLSFDGVRLRVIYGSRKSVATIYLRSPSYVYNVVRFSRALGFELNLPLKQSHRAYVADSFLRRELEGMMLRHGSTYDAGRLGAEIALAIAESKFKLSNLLITEPSARGRDLYTTGGEVSIQSRLLRDFPKWKDENSVRIELLSLISKLRQDAQFNSKMRSGLAVLSRQTGARKVRSLIVDIDFNG